MARPLSLPSWCAKVKNLAPEDVGCLEEIPIALRLYVCMYACMCVLKFILEGYLSVMWCQAQKICLHMQEVLNTEVGRSMPL